MDQNNPILFDILAAPYSEEEILTEYYVPNRKKSLKEKLVLLLLFYKSDLPGGCVCKMLFAENFDMCKKDNRALIGVISKYFYDASIKDNNDQNSSDLVE